MYSAIAAYSKQEDGSINAKYVLGTGEDSDGSVTNFTPIISDYKWIDAVAAKFRSHLCLLKRARTDYYLII